MHTPVTDKDHPPVLDGWTSLLAFWGTPQGPPLLEAAGVNHTILLWLQTSAEGRFTSKLWLNLLPLQASQRDLLPPRSPSLHAAG